MGKDGGCCGDEVERKKGYKEIPSLSSFTFLLSISSYFSFPENPKEKNLARFAGRKTKKKFLATSFLVWAGCVSCFCFWLVGSPLCTISKIPFAFQEARSRLIAKTKL